MDNPINAAIRVRESDPVRYSSRPSQSSLSVPPLIREVVRVSARWLTEATSFSRKNVASTSPSFAIRPHGSADLPLMADHLPWEVWELISRTFTPEDMQRLFSTCRAMQACLIKCIDNVKHQYNATEIEIARIANDRSCRRIIGRAKLQEFLRELNCVKVNLSRCDRKQDVLTVLAQSKSMELIRLNANEVSDHLYGEDLAWVLAQLDDVAIELFLAGNYRWTNREFRAVFKSIAASDSVLRLNLNFNNLRELKRSEPFFSMLFAPRSRIGILSLAGIRVGDQLLGCLSDFGLSLLAYGLNFNLLPMLRTINLCNTSIQRRQTDFPEIVQYFNFNCGHPLIKRKKYIRFCLRQLKIEKKSGLQVIIESLGDNKTVTAINLSNCEIDSKMTQIIADSLQNNNALKNLYLYDNLIGNKGIKALAKAIRQHPALELLGLSSKKRIKKKGWIDFFTALSGNTSMGCLNLRGWAIGDEGAVALAAMLKANCTLKELLLSNTQITVNGITALADSLREHPSIKLLDLAGNYIPHKDIPVLQYLADDGIRVRVNTDIRHKAAKANGTSPETPDKGNQDEDVIQRANVWL